MPFGTRKILEAIADLRRDLMEHMHRKAEGHGLAVDSARQEIISTFDTRLSDVRGQLFDKLRDLRDTREAGGRREGVPAARGAARTVQEDIDRLCEQVRACVAEVAAARAAAESARAAAESAHEAAAAVAAAAAAAAAVSGGAAVAAGSGPAAGTGSSVADGVPSAGPGPAPAPREDPAESRAEAWDRHRRLLGAAAGIAVVPLSCHRDTWAYLVQQAVAQPHFRVPGEVVPGDDGRVRVDLSGPSLIAALTALWETAQGDGAAERGPSDWALAGRIYDRIAAAVEDVAPSPDAGAIVIDDRP
ncbi:hypothetical protein [Streptomyces sp. URMC 123]|uniref:hypothetical protein n=1 Tax=Streptomyces sp. URMC 123 TaxID=3423403 RepID=UPI003F1AD2E9